MTTITRHIKRIAPHIGRIMKTPDADDLVEIVLEATAHIVSDPQDVLYITGIMFLMYQIGHLRGESRDNIFEKMVVRDVAGE